MTTPYEQARTIAQALLKGDSPPFTQELIRQRVLSACSLARLEPGEVEKLVKELEASFNVWIGVQSVLDNDDDHVPWLAHRRAAINWRYWNRFQRLLEEEQGWPRNTVERLGELTDAVLERLEDPRREGAWDRRGLVAGHVQSGKTANYTGLICKAADAGYRLIVVLAGIHSSLRSQTQVRLDEGFLGYDSRQAQGDGARRPIGVGRLDPGCPAPNTITTSLETGDFNANVARQFNINPGDRPLLFVVKKNASVLRNLLSWVSRATPHKDENDQPVVLDLPILMIDDEADFASVDTRAIPIDENGEPDREHDPTTINRLIRSLLRTFRQSAYVGYTATPFANIFIHESAETREHGPDLFPRSFIINLPAPSNYVGPARVFGLDADPATGVEGSPGMPIVRKVSDHQEWMPDGHKKEHVPGDLPQSLREAIRAFVLACTARLARGHDNAHNSMLVHVTRFTAVQEKVTGLVRAELKAIQQRLRRCLVPSGYRHAREVQEPGGWWPQVDPVVPGQDNRPRTHAEQEAQAMPRDEERPRRRPRRDEGPDDEAGPPRPRRKGLRDEDEADSRVYVHDACGSETEVSGDDFARLANPFAWVSQTYCAACGGYAGLRRFAWADTGESITSYRRRLRRRAPLSLKLWGWLFGPLLGMAVGAAIGFLVASRGPVAGAFAGGLTGALVFPLFLVPYLAKWVWGIDYRRMR